MSVLTSGLKDSYILKPILNSLPKVCNTNIRKTCKLCIYEIVLTRWVYTIRANCSFCSYLNHFALLACIKTLLYCCLHKACSSLNTRNSYQGMKQTFCVTPFLIFMHLHARLGQMLHLVWDTHGTSISLILRVLYQRPCQTYNLNRFLKIEKKTVYKSKTHSAAVDIMILFLCQQRSLVNEMTI